VAHIAAVLALIPNSIEKEVVAKGAKHELKELFLNKFVAIHFMHFSFSFPDGTLTPKTA
jgi:hypothetical protein